MASELKLSIKNALMERLELGTPILQAPMAGGGDTPDMIAASGEIGALGTMGAAYLRPDQITQSANAIKEKSNRGFGINLFAPVESPPLPAKAKRAVDHIAPYYFELGLPKPELPDNSGFNLDEQVKAMLESGASLFSFTFGIMPPDIISAAKEKGMLVMGTATTIAEAKMLQEAGVDAVIAQGMEAGGHRGTFTGDFGAGQIGTMALVPQIVDQISLPVVASGGIMDGRGIAAALALGASAVQMGTAFLTTQEAGIPQAYKKAILRASPENTRVTQVFSGRPARGIVNRFMEESERGSDKDRAEEKVLPYPYQNALTRPMRSAAGQAGRAELLSLWAGQGLGLARELSTRELYEQLISETAAAIKALKI